MYTSTEGIIFRQVKAAGGRRMILLFTKKYGKISAGSSLSEKGRTKAALALRPFTYGNYELYKGRESYNINSAEVKRSFFRIGEDVDKYMESSFVLELTEKMTPEDLPQPRLSTCWQNFSRPWKSGKRSIAPWFWPTKSKPWPLWALFPSWISAPAAPAVKICGISVSKTGAWSAENAEILPMIH